MQTWTASAPVFLSVVTGLCICGTKKAGQSLWPLWIGPYSSCGVMVSACRLSRGHREEGKFQVMKPNSNKREWQQSALGMNEQRQVELATNQRRSNYTSEIKTNVQIGGGGMIPPYYSRWGELQSAWANTSTQWKYTHTFNNQPGILFVSVLPLLAFRDDQ